MTDIERTVINLGGGGRFYYKDQEWRVLEVFGAYVRARDEAGAESFLAIHDLVEAGEFVDDSFPRAVLTDRSRNEPYHDAIMDLLAANDAAGVAAASACSERILAVQLLRTGYPDGIDDPDRAPHPDYGPQNGLTLEARVALYGEREGHGERTIWRWLRTANKHGLAGLIDKRRLQASSPMRRCPIEVVEAMAEVAARQAHESAKSIGFQLEEVVRIVKDRYGDTVKIPASSTLRAYYASFHRGTSQHLSKQSQRSIADRPKRIGPPLTVSRPFEVVEIDSQRMDFLAVDRHGKTVSVILTLAIDVYSRSIVAWHFSPVSEKGVDAALLLYNMLCLKLWNPEWGEQARWRYGIPESLVMPGVSLAGIPGGTPATVTLDNAKVYASQTMQSACLQLGINIQYARKRRPTDKPHIERLFQTINMKFTQKLPAHKGNSVYNRGEEAKIRGEACLLISQIDQLFAQWVAVEYQNTPHKGLFHPGIPTGTFTPNEMFDIGIATTGFVRVLRDTDFPIRLLPSTSRIVGPVGIEVNNLSYDSDALNPYRQLLSPFPELKGRWPVRFDPRDLSYIYFWAGDPTDPRRGHWVRIPARIRRAVGAFSDVHLEYAKSLFSDEDRLMGRHRDREAVEATVTEMFDRVRTFGPANKREENAFRFGDERVAASAIGPLVHDPAFEDADIDDEIDIEDFNADDYLDLTSIQPFNLSRDADEGASWS